MNLTIQELGRRIATARIEAGMTQAELAQQVGIDRTALAKIEKGDRKIDSLELVSVSEALDVSVDSLLRQTKPLVIHLRDVEGLDSRSKKEVEWVQNFMDDYSFLKQLADE